MHFNTPNLGKATAESIVRGWSINQLEEYLKELRKFNVEDVMRAVKDYKEARQYPIAISFQHWMLLAVADFCPNFEDRLSQQVDKPIEYIGGKVVSGVPMPTFQPPITYTKGREPGYNHTSDTKPLKDDLLFPPPPPPVVADPSKLGSMPKQLKSEPKPMITLETLERLRKNWRKILGTLWVKK